MISSASLFRRLAIIDAPTYSKAIELVKTSTTFKNDSLTTIDMTSDFNQNKWLGSEFKDTLIFFDSQSTPNGLLSLFGCIKAPHTLYLAYDASCIKNYFKEKILLPKLSTVVQNCELQKYRSTLSDDSSHTPLESLTKNQGIIHLTGERGSGKSTLLGHYIENLINNEQEGIVLCSPSPAASKNTLSFLQQYPYDVPRETFAYLQINDLLKNLEQAQEIIIDEAATYPQSHLNTIIFHAENLGKKLVLSTTIEGYEGTGQGYRLNYLNKVSANILHLDQPKRFAIGDPLYRMVNKLYNPSTTIQTQKLTENDGNYVLSTEELRSRGWTAACFALLRQAHYKTTPNDLERFYNFPAIFGITIKKGEVVGASYAVSERLPNDVSSQAIFFGKRRVKNAFTQQAIISAYGNITVNKKINNTFSSSRILRISRIATKVSHRHQKIASNLIQILSNYAQSNNYDFLSTSFSASKQNMGFWSAQQFVPVRVGLYPNKINNEYALLMLYALTDVSRETENLLKSYYKRHINYFCKAYSNQQALLIKGRDRALPELSIEELHNELESVISHHRDINWLLPVLANQTGNNLQGKCGELLSGEIRKKSTKSTDLKQLKCIKDALTEYKTLLNRQITI